MKVFISWSGAKSGAVARALGEWVRPIINSVDPFVSSTDIYAGDRWESEIAAQLKTTNFGIVCVTAMNQDKPWLNFEAGALAKEVGSSRVVPLAVDLKLADIKPPLGQFQGRSLDKAGITEVMASINNACEESDRPLSDPMLQKSIEKWWPDLKERLDAISVESATPAKRSRSERELIEEILAGVRNLGRVSTAAGPDIAPAALDDLDRSWTRFRRLMATDVRDRPQVFAAVERLAGPLDYILAVTSQSRRSRSRRLSSVQGDLLAAAHERAAAMAAAAEAAAELALLREREAEATRLDSSG